MLSEDVTRYVDLHRAVGFKFHTQQGLLRNFAAFAEASGDEVVRVDRVLDWAVLAPSPCQRRNRLNTVRRFALAMRAEDTRYEVPAADALGRGWFERCAPHIYTSDEIGRLLQALSQLSSARSIKPLTYATLFGLLAATGMRISEALALRIADITDDGLIIRHTKFKKSRLLPLHDTTQQALDAYLSARLRYSRPDDSLFVNNAGGAVSYNTVAATFRRLARTIGLRGGPGLPGPRIHDLRHNAEFRIIPSLGWFDAGLLASTGRHIGIIRGS